MRNKYDVINMSVMSVFLLYSRTQLWLKLQYAQLLWLQLETGWTVCFSGLMLMWMWCAGITPPAQHHTIRSGPHCSTYQRKPHPSLTQRASPAPAPPRPRPDGTMESPSPVWAKPASWVSTQWGFWLHRWHIQQNTDSHCVTCVLHYESCYDEGNLQTSTDQSQNC